MSVTPFKRTRLIIRPMLKLEERKACHIRIEAKMFAGRRPTRKRTDVSANAQNREPPTLVNVVNLETNELAQLQLQTQLKDALTSEYPDEGYVGKCFSITRLAYGRYDLAEIEDPATGLAGTGELATHPAARAKR